MRLETLVPHRRSRGRVRPPRLETFDERGRTRHARAGRRRPSALADRRAGAAVPGALQRPVPARAPRWWARSPPITAFDYLHERPFDAVVLWAGDNPPGGAVHRRGHAPQHPPLSHARPALHAPGELRDDRPRPIIAASPTWPRPRRPSSETRARVVGAGPQLPPPDRHPLARLEKARSSGLMDAATGPLHPRPVRRPPRRAWPRPSRVRNRPLSGLRAEGRREARGERPRAPAAGWTAPFPQIGSMIGRLVRVEDTAARLGPRSSPSPCPPPASPRPALAGERIAAVIGCTAFEAGEGKPPFVVDFDLGVAEVRRTRNRRPSASRRPPPGRSTEGELMARYSADAGLDLSGSGRIALAIALRARPRTLKVERFWIIRADAAGRR